MNDSINPAALVLRATSAFAIYSALLAGKIVVALLIVAGIVSNDSALISAAVAMLVVLLIAAAIGLGLKRGSNVARWIAVVFISLASLGNAGDVLTLLNRWPTASLSSPVAFNGLSGAALLAAGVATVVVLLAGSTRAAYAAPSR